MKIALIVPCYNEQEALPIFYREMSKIMKEIDCQYELIFVNDGSKDNISFHFKRTCRKG